MLNAAEGGIPLTDFLAVFRFTLTDFLAVFQFSLVVILVVWSIISMLSFSFAYSFFYNVFICLSLRLLKVAQVTEML